MDLIGTKRAESSSSYLKHIDLFVYFGFAAVGFNTTLGFSTTDSEDFCKPTLIAG